MSRTRLEIFILFVFLHHHFLISSIIDCAPLAPALYVFGDSLFDSGNNNLLPTIAKADFLPYGMNFVKGVTGRFTNGRTVPDFLAEYLRLPYPPPYMGIRESTPLTGLNYASASCGILPQTGSQMGKCLSLDDQINMFQYTVKSQLPKHFNSTNELADHLSKSILVISIGSNDYINNYLESKIFDTSKLYTPQQFAQLLLNSLSQKFEKLYNLGVRKVIMFEIGPIGCIPSLSRKFSESGKCAEESNLLVKDFNDELPKMLQNLTSTLAGSTFAHGHASWLGYDAVMNPSRYGLMDASNPCCKTWGNGTSACIPWLTPCPNPSIHYFFDAYHLTEALYSIIADHCISNATVCSPTVQQLTSYS